MAFTDWIEFQRHIAALEKEGRVTRTFRRLDPERQQAVLEAILDEAVEKGPTALNIKRVAERAGVSVGSLYTYFRSRDGLLDFAIELCTRFMTDAFEAYRPYLCSRPLRQGLSEYLLGGLEWGRMQAGLVGFFARGAYHGDPELVERVVRPVAKQMRQIVHEMLARAVERGEVRPDLDLEAVARLVHALTIVVGDSLLLPYLDAYFQLADESTSPDRLMPALLELILSGIGTEPG